MILKSVACDGKSHWILSRDRSQTFTYSPDGPAFARFQNDFCPIQNSEIPESQCSMGIQCSK